MKKNTWLLIALIAVIFVSGAASGFFAGRLTAPKRSRKHHKYSRSKEKMKAIFEQRIYRRLKLSDEQKQSAKIIIDNWLDEMRKLRQLHAPQYLAVFNKFHTQITPLLTPEQIVELNKWHSKFTKHKASLSQKGDNNAKK